MKYAGLSACFFLVILAGCGPECECTCPQTKENPNAFPFTGRTYSGKACIDKSILVNSSGQSATFPVGVRGIFAVMKAAGYPEGDFKIFDVDEGFAIMFTPERLDENGRKLPSSDRFRKNWTSGKDGTWARVEGVKVRYRIFAFIISKKEPINEKVPAVFKDAASYNWISTVPDKFQKLQIPDDIRVTCLAYHFESPEGDASPVQLSLEKSPDIGSDFKDAGIELPLCLRGN